MSAILTPRLTLMPATVESLEAEITSPAHLARLLSCKLPASWPPPLNDEESQRWMLKYLQEHRGSRWGMWYITISADRQLIGNCGFKGDPANRAVEIGYSIAPEFHRRGFATEAVQGLLRFAFSDPHLDHVIAETLPELLPSIGVLRKCGFVPIEGASEPGILRFSHPRSSGAPS